MPGFSFLHNGANSAHQLDDEVGDFLHEDDQSRRLLVVGGVGPDEAHQVVKGGDSLFQLGVLALLQDFQLPSEWLQVHATAETVREESEVHHLLIWIDRFVRVMGF